MYSHSSNQNHIYNLLRHPKVLALRQRCHELDFTLLNVCSSSSFFYLRTDKSNDSKKVKNAKPWYPAVRIIVKKPEQKKVEEKPKPEHSKTEEHKSEETKGTVTSSGLNLLGQYGDSDESE